jgi:hypothetical protein
VLGFVLWCYTVVALVIQGRPAGYGLAFMFIAGYALQLSHLTLLVVLGLMLLTLDRRPMPSRVGERSPAEPGSAMVMGSHSLTPSENKVGLL